MHNVRMHIMHMCVCLKILINMSYALQFSLSILYVMIFLGNHNIFGQREIREIPEGEYQEVKTLESNFI